MKIAQHFRAFLEGHQYLHLPQIGRFEVVGEKPDASEKSSSTIWVKFSADKNQATDPDLVTFISDKMKIESCITASDLVSFIGSIKELLIQGFEVEIPRIGYLHFEQGNILRFSGKNIYKKPTQKSWKKIPAMMSSSFWL
jgi:hypothetical protein